MATETDNTIKLELTRAEAVADRQRAVHEACGPNNVRPPFDTFAEVAAMEDGYQKIATPISELQGCRCARCDRPWTETMNAWDSIGDPETGELELVCQDCVAPEERAMHRSSTTTATRESTRSSATPRPRGSSDRSRDFESDDSLRREALPLPLGGAGPTPGKPRRTYGPGPMTRTGTSHSAASTAVL